MLPTSGELPLQDKAADTESFTVQKEWFIKITSRNCYNSPKYLKNFTPTISRYCCKISGKQILNENSLNVTSGHNCKALSFDDGVWLHTPNPWLAISDYIQFMMGFSKCHGALGAMDEPSVFARVQHQLQLLVTR